MALTERRWPNSNTRTYLNYMFITFICLNIYLLVKHDDPEITPVIHYQPFPEDDISCHVVEDAALPAINTSVTTDKRIFFIETSCKGGIDSRQACAIESASRANPNWRIETLFLGPVTSMFLKSSLYKTLSKMDNVVFSRENLIDFTKNTPLDSPLNIGFVHLSKKRKVQHISDLIRLLTLYKYGGVYLDLDVVVVKSFDTLSKNWIGKQEEDLLGAGAIGFSNDKVGRQIANFTITHFINNFNPFLWDDSSVGVIMRALRQICNKQNVTEMNADVCSGIEIYDTINFYPVFYTKWQTYMDPLPLTLRDTYSCYTHHTWNALSHNCPIPRLSKYAKLAKLFCPSIYNLYKNEFGM